MSGLSGSPDLSFHLTALGVTAVHVQGREVSPHIIRMNLIIAELYDEDDVCEHCGSPDITDFKQITPEYRDLQPGHYEINAYGSTAVDCGWKERRDMIEQRRCCNFCSHVISLGFNWSDWYKVQDFSVGASDQLIINTTGTSSNSGDFIWQPNTTLGIRTFTIDCSDKQYGYSMGCSVGSNSNGDRFWDK